MDDAAVHLFDLHAPKPAGVDVFAQFAAQPRFYPRPSAAWRALLLLLGLCVWSPCLCLCHGVVLSYSFFVAPLRTARINLSSQLI
jgi:hypothetical protein